MENENPALLGQSGAPGTLLPARKGRRAPLRQHAGRARGFERNPARAGSGRLKKGGVSGALRRVLPSNFCLKGSARATSECARGSDGTSERGGKLRRQRRLLDQRERTAFH